MIGWRISNRRRTVTVFLSVPPSMTLLRNLRAGGGIAVVFARPAPSESIPLMGAATRIVPLSEGDRVAIKTYAGSCLRDTLQFDYKESFASAMTTSWSYCVLPHD